MQTKRNEISYYTEIKHFIEEQLKSNFFSKGSHPLNVYWEIGELKTKLNQIIKEHPKECNCAKEFANRVPPLSLDIFALITNNKKFELLILEVKLMHSVGLKEWSQLMGYCLVSKAKYGLLININNSASARLQQLLTTDCSLSEICTVQHERKYTHFMSFMTWDSLTNCFEYTNLGALKSLSELSQKIAQEFI